MHAFCCLIRPFLATALLLVGTTVAAAEPSVVPQWVGRWEGQAEIIVAWCRQKQLRVSVEVRPDGRVTGRVGEATLSGARLSRNRGWLGRQLGLATDWRVHGELVGPVVAAEGIVRESVSIPLDFRNGVWQGGVHTSGSKFGGAAAGRLSAAGLILRRAP